MDSEICAPESHTRESFAAMLVELNWATGTKGVVNEKDIPVILEKIRTIASLSQEHYNFFNDPYVMNILLHSLSEKYLLPPEHFAAMFGSYGANIWLWEHIKEQKYDKIYDVIQNVRNIVHEVAQEAKEIDSDVRHKEIDNSPNPFYKQTKEGFIFHYDGMSSCLSTPFGEVSIMCFSGASSHTEVSIIEVVLHRLAATLRRPPYVSERHSSNYRINSNIYRVSLPESLGMIRKISCGDVKRINKDESKRYIGSQAVLYNGNCGISTIYNISKTPNGTLPDYVKHQNESEKRSYETVNHIWEMVKANRLGKDHLKVGIKNVTPKSEPKLPIIPVCQCLFDIPSWVINVLEILDKQEVHPISKQAGYPIKLMELTEYSRDVDNLISASTEYLTDETKWWVHKIGQWETFKTSEGRKIKEGIQLWILPEYERCSIETLKGIIETIIMKMRQGWEKTFLREYPDILHTESEEKYELFIKKEQILTDLSVLPTVAHLLGIREYIHCGSNWKKPQLCIYEPVYLWIKKGHVEEVVSKLELEVK